MTEAPRELDQACRDPRAADARRSATTLVGGALEHVGDLLELAGDLIGPDAAVAHWRSIDRLPAAYREIRAAEAAAR